MRLGSAIIALLGVGIAGGSVYMAQDLIPQNQGAAVAAPTVPLVEVFVASRDIEFGSPIDATVLRRQPWPSDALPEGAITDPAVLLASTNGEPRRSRTKLYKNEIMLEPKLSGFGEKITIVQKLGTNTRAMAIQVDAVTAVGGFVTPGDYVDILLTTGGGGSELRSVTILQKVRVIGVDQTSGEDNAAPQVVRTITVEVTPDDGQKLALAQRAGTLSLALRTEDAVEDKPMDMIQLQDLLQEKAPVPVTEKKPQIVVRRGVDTVVQN